ncbi:MAG: helicase C-terminal domain-containing protein [bacterium]
MLSGIALNPEERVFAGREIHRLYAEKRASEHDGFRSEEPLHASLTIDDARIEMNARLDGIWEENPVTIIEEVKSSFPRDDLPRPHHVMQLDAYLWMYSLHHSGDVQGRLTYILPDGSERIFDRVRSGDIAAEFIERIRVLLRWHRRESQRLQGRAEKTSELLWPFTVRRDGQGELESRASQSVRDGKLLLCEAPTGMGKTAPLLLGALRECSRSGSRLLYATSRTSQQSDRVELLDSFGSADAVGHVLLLGSQERLGVDPTTRSEDWPFDRYDPPEWLDLLWGDGTAITPEHVTMAARENDVDPRALQRELAFHADVIVGDLNLLALPGSAYHPSRFEKPFRNVMLMVDEAHGLPDRLRNRSASNLRLKQLKRVSDLLEDAASPAAHSAAEVVMDLCETLEDRLRSDEDNLDLPPRERIDLVSEGWLSLIEQASSALSSLELFENPPILEAYYELEKLSRFKGSNAFVFWIDRSSRSLKGELIETGELFSESWKRMQSVLFFSATLTPVHLFSRDLGLAAERTEYSILPEFHDRDNRLVLRFAGLSTTFRKRDDHLGTLTDMLAEVPARTGGRWAVFFPSTAYLRNAERELAGRGITLAVLSPGVPIHLLERILEGAEGPSLLMAVMGGAIGEGVELPAGTYDGCIIVSPGVPPPSTRGELLLERFEDDQEARAQAAHLPGLIRARQAAGRLFRAPDQRGIIILAGQRYADERLAVMLPDAWASSPVVQSIKELLDIIDRWW